MRSTSLAILLFAATIAAAQQSPRPTFPDDYTPSPCAPDSPCESYPRTQIKAAAFTMLGLQLDGRWVEDHYNQMLQLFAPVCRKLATCYATPGNNFLFCDDIVVPEYRAVCDKTFPKATHPADWEQCKGFTEIWALGVDMRGKMVAEPAQACALEKKLNVVHTKPPIVWMVPETVPRDYKGNIWIYALDPDTHIPVQANITIDRQQVFAPSNPAGSVATGYPFKWPVKYNRVKNAEGHMDVVAPTVTVKPDSYPPVTFVMPSPAPKMLVEMKPAKLHAGVNKVTVTARDAESGKPVEARVMVGENAAGEANEPIEITVPKGGKLPEVWVTSLFDVYSDVVVK